MIKKKYILRSISKQTALSLKELYRNMQKYVKLYHFVVYSGARSIETGKKNRICQFSFCFVVVTRAFVWRK